MRKILPERRKRITQLRLRGKSILEICKETGEAKTTVQRYVREIKVPKKYRDLLREKQGGSRDRAKYLRECAIEKSAAILGTLSDRDLLLLLIGLYWGEGTKRDFSIINSDPSLIQTFIHCLDVIQVPKNRITLSLRVHSDISISDSKRFWSHATGLPIKCITRIEVIHGKKRGKLPYGMCRVRVTNGIRDRVFVQSSISFIGKYCASSIVSS